MANGLTLITPSSVSASGSATATIQDVNTVVITGANNTDKASVDGIFSSTYHNYLLVVSDYSNSGAALGLQLRVGGSDATSNYDRQFLSIQSTSATGGESTGQPTARISNGGGVGDFGAIHVYVFGPNLAAATCIRSITTRNILNDAAMLDYATIHTTATAYTGITFTAESADTHALKLRVYGFNK